MERNENTGSVPNDPARTGVMDDEDAPDEQPTTVAGGGLGPLETAIEDSEKSKD